FNSVFAKEVKFPIMHRVGNNLIKNFNEVNRSMELNEEFQRSQ
ncbi:14030_t:CDS:1, partial [Dentiscutata heterogama]